MSQLEKVVCSQCSQKNFPSFSSSQHVPKRFFHHSLHLFALPDAPTTGLRWKKVAHSQCSQKNLSIIPFISLFFLILQQQVSTGKRWHILNVPKKTFPSFFSSQHVPKRFFHHSLHLLVLLDALTSGLCRKR